MSANTKIEWADHTFNPWIGCNAISPGCKSCYAGEWAKRYGRDFADRTRTSPANWHQPIKWNAEAARLGIRYRVFCASLADVFDNEVSEKWRIDLFDVIEQTPHLDWLLLTKRIGNTARMLPWSACSEPWSNVWIGATIVNQAEADRDIPKLLQVPAAKRFLSMEPMLGPVDLTHLPTGTCASECCGMQRLDSLSGREVCDLSEQAFDDGPGIDWVIVGGESGRNARPMHPDWARSLRDQCQAAGVPFLFKQWGEWLPLSHQTGGADPEQRQCHIWPDGMVYSGNTPMTSDCAQLSRVGKKNAGRLLDGHTWDEVPV